MKLQFLRVAALSVGIFLAPNLMPKAAAADAPAKPAPAALPLPTLQDLHEMYDAKQYTICIQQIGRVLRLTGDEAKRHDKFTLQLLRGDCLLHLDDRASAIAAYQAAAKSLDPKVSVPARANELLARASDKMAYKPKSAAAAEPISIVEDGSRRLAMAAMFADQLADATGVLRQAKSAEDLTPIISAVPKVLDLYALETTATGKADRMWPDMVAIGERARSLIDKELGLVNAQIGGVEKRADQVIDSAYVRAGSSWWSNSGVVRKGLTSNDRKDLRDTIDYLARIHQSAERGQQIARQVDGNIAAWDAVLERIAHTSVYAQNVLDAD